MNDRNKEGQAQPGYRMTEIGEIPEEWELKKLDAIGTFSKGKGISKTDLKDEGIPCITYGEIYTRHDIVIRDFHSYIPTEVAEKSALIEMGDILFAGSGETLEDIGKCVAFAFDIEAYAGGDIVILRPTEVDSQADSVFLSYCLNSNIGTWQMGRMGQGYSIVHIYGSHLKDVMIPLPPILEQRKITTILSTVDDAILKTQEIIERSQRLKRGLMQKLLTKGIGHTRFKESPLGEIPEEWGVARVRDVCNKPQYGFTASAKDEPLGPKFLRITDIQNGRVNWDTVPYCDCPDTTIEKYTLKSGDILFARTGATTGKSYLVEDPPEAVFASYLIRVVSREEVLTDFLYLVFKSDIYWRQITRSIMGSSQGGVNASLLSEINIPLPPLPEQREIAGILSNVDDKIESEEQYRFELERAKRGLMQILLTGKVKVKVGT